MAFTFRPAARENVSLLIGLSGGTGSGKTFTAMRLAAGIAGDRAYCVIDTEAGRAKHYADRFKFDHGDLPAPFTPARYTEAIAAANDAGYPVIVVDSMSHEWAGHGGVLDMQESVLDRMAGDDWKKRESCRMASWIQPKMEHKRFVDSLTQIRAHLILCFRAEPKIEMVKNDAGKYEIREKQSLTGLQGWMPVTEKNLPFELTASFMLMADHPGVPLPIKLQEQHKHLFPLDRVIDEQAGAKLAEWARGGAEAPKIDWVKRIADAKSRAELEQVGKSLAAEALPADQRKALRATYQARWDKLPATKGKRGGGARAVSQEDIQWH